MKRCTKLFMIFLLGSALFSKVDATTIVVNQAGGDDYTTIQAGINAAYAGDVVYVKNGTYYECNQITRSGSSESLRITLAAYPGHHPVIDGTGVTVPDWKGLIYSGDLSGGTQYITIDGFEIRNTGWYGIIGMKCSHWIIRNCKGHNCGAQGKGEPIHFGQSNDMLIQNNEVYNSGWNGINIMSGNNNILEYNYSHDNPYHYGMQIITDHTNGVTAFNYNNILRNNIIKNNLQGMYFRNAVNMKVYNNLIAYNELGVLYAGIYFGDGDGTSTSFASNSVVYNNTIVGQKHSIANQSHNNVTYKNNILAYPSYSIFKFTGGGAIGQVTDYNLYVGVDYANKGSNDIYTTTNPFNGTDDYTLYSNSPAVDHGTNLSSAGVTVDLIGTSRPQGDVFDIGAYEYGSGGSAPELPAGAIDAEDGTLTSPMVSVSDGSATGGYYIQTGTTNSGTASYTVNVSSDGIYTIVGRVNTATQSSNSFYITIDQGTEGTWHTAITGGSWAEDTAHADAALTQRYEVELASGNHTIALRGRETETKLDYFYLTKVAGIAHTLTVISGTGDGNYTEGTQVNISPDSAPTGQEFNQWTGDTLYLNSPVTTSGNSINMPDISVSVTSTYQNIPYTLTVANGDGDGSSYVYQQVVNITADTPPTGYEFDEWTGDVSYIADVNDPTTTVTMPASNVSVTATYSLSVSVTEAENGSLSSPMVSVSDGSASGGYYIWSQTVNSGTATYTVSIPSDGIYTIVGRVNTASQASNSFFIKIDQGNEEIWHTAITSGSWMEDTAHLDAGLTLIYEVELTSGNHTIILRGRETGTKLDYFYLVKVSEIVQNIALNKAVIDSSGAQTENPTTNAIDGNTGTRWSASGLLSTPQWIEIDLGDIYNVNATELVCYGDRDYQFTVEVKTTLGGTYTEVVDRSANTQAGTIANPIRDEFADTEARYVKLIVTGAAVYSGDWCSIIELRVFNSGTLKSAKIPTGNKKLSFVSEAGITIYPNPVQSTLFVAGDPGWEGRAKIAVYTLQGNKIYQTLSEVAFPHAVDVSSYLPGIYIIRVTKGDEYYTQKVIKK